MLPLGRKILAAQPFSTVLGAELHELAGGRAEIRIPVQRFMMQQHGVLHGGVIAYAADNTIAFAAGSILGEGVVNAAHFIQYLKPARGHTVVARATVAHHSTRSAACRCEVYVTGDDGGEQLCAVAQGSVAVRG